MIVFVVIVLLLSISIGDSININDCTIGIIGVGKIGSCLCKGYANYLTTTTTSTSDSSIDGSSKRILVTNRGINNVNKLINLYPNTIEIATTTEIIERCDVIFIALLPVVARQLLPLLKFSNKNLIISMMASIDIDEVVSLTQVSSDNIVKIVPLPSISTNTGPILVYPNNDIACKLLEVVGSPFPCSNEDDMKPLVSMTGHISSFYELMRVSQDWLTTEGVDSHTGTTTTTTTTTNATTTTSIQ